MLQGSKRASNYRPYTCPTYHIFEDRTILVFPCYPGILLLNDSHRNTVNQSLKNKGKVIMSCNYEWLCKSLTWWYSMVPVLLRISPDCSPRFIWSFLRRALAWASLMMDTLTWGGVMFTLSFPPTSSRTVAVNLVLVFITCGGCFSMMKVLQSMHHLLQSLVSYKELYTVYVTVSMGKTITKSCYLFQSLIHW